MATLAPPPTSAPPQKEQRKQLWLERFLRSRYFLYSFLISLVIFLLVSGTILFKGFNPPGEFEEGDYLAGDDGGGPPPAPASSAPSETPPTEVPVEVPTTQTSTDLLAVDTPSPDSFTVPLPTTLTPTPDLTAKATPAPAAPASSSNNFSARAEGVRGFSNGWGPGSGSGKGSSGIKGSGRSTQAEFTCYVARYNGEGWAATLEAPTSFRKEYRGSIPNLLRFTSEQTKGRIKANLVPNPLRLDSSEIFDKKPPFIYFNGRKDFVLTAKEVENLQKYLMLGGAIWGDTALAGTGSRFDVAFRREMKRVIPDEDKPFEIVPNDHPIYTNSYFSLKGPPAGMNYYQQPLEMIRIDKEIAILYTPNDYGDMMRMAFKPNSTEPNVGKSEKEIYITPPEMWELRNTFYRNFTPEESEASFKLGLNIIVHLLTRFQEKLGNF
jgi:hypothetical protein